jgi:hypothetical protein
MQRAVEAGALAVYRDVAEILSRLDETPLAAERSVSPRGPPCRAAGAGRTATAHAACRVIRPREGKRFEAYAPAGDRFVHMDLSLRPSGSVEEATETYLKDQIVVVNDGPQAAIEVHHADGRRFLSVPGEVRAAVTAFA